ncbi:MAG TPA: hypothetical protein VJ438_03940 [Candidatus Nanoarchaeia archaeon]|nr:hypothetical protein [Candidatus Nanoarchaeia archaeon]
MREKDATKKWFILLVVMVAINLVVNLIYLNVLYNLGNNSDSFKGSLATSRSECEAAANNKYRSLLDPLYAERENLRQNLYALEKIRNQNCDEVYKDLKSSGYCIDRASIEWDIGNLKTKIDNLSKQIYKGLTAWLAELLKCRSGGY